MYFNFSCPETVVPLSGNHGAAGGVGSGEIRHEESSALRTVAWRFGGFLKMGNPQVTMGFNTKMVYMTWMIWGTPILGNPHLLIIILF